MNTSVWRTRPVAGACSVILPGFALCTGIALADGSNIDKIYHPYVTALEREVELRTSIEEGRNAVSEDRQLWRLGYGQSVSDNWFGELYLIGERDNTSDLHLDRYEAEALWQLAEQGEYPVDSGLLFEFEKIDSSDNMEIAGTLLLEKDVGSWSGTANLRLRYEFGGDIRNEFETAANLQFRYRYTALLEPGLEFYSSENILGLGPVLLGDIRYGEGRKLHWETGLIAGLGAQTPDRSWRLLLEYEF